MRPVATGARELDVVLVVAPGTAEAALPLDREPPGVALLRAAARQGAPFRSLTVLTPPEHATRAHHTYPHADHVIPGHFTPVDHVIPGRPVPVDHVIPGRFDDVDHAVVGPPAGVFVAFADVVVSGPPLGDLLTDPRFGTGALVSAAGESLGAVRVSAAARARLADAPEGADLMASLAAVGEPVRAVPLGPYRWARPRDAAELDAARAAVAALDEDRVRLRASRRGGDGLWSTLALRRVSPQVTRLAVREGWTPNALTLASFAIGLAAAGCLAAGGRGLALAGALLLQLSLVVDCADGEVARYTRRFTALGAWLDATTDRVKEFAVLLALGLAAGGDDGWLLAAAAVTVQTVRGLLALGWAQQRPSAGPASVTSWRPPAERAIQAEFRAERPGVIGWLRRVGHLPIGERFLIVSVGAVAVGPAVTLRVLVAAGLLAGAYALAAFAVRSAPVRGRRLAALGPAAGAALALGTLLAAASAASGAPRAALAAATAAAGLAGYAWAYRAPRPPAAHPAAAPREPALAGGVR